MTNHEGKRQRALGLLPTIHHPLATILCLLLLPGCGPPGPETAPVSGVVLMDGKPVAAATVMFVPNEGGRPARGETDSDGKFQLTTFRERDGALLGRHAVTVTKVRTGAVATQDGLPLPNGQSVKIEWITPEKYSRADRSGLSAEVRRGSNALELRLSSRN